MPKILNSNILKFFALFFMLLDHLWATIIPGNNWMTYVGRLAFPIFAFFIAEGFEKTKDKNKYLKRLFLFALISEIPFNLMYISSTFFIFHQNVFFTLLLGLWGIMIIDNVIYNFSTKKLIQSIFKLTLIFILSVLGFVDYGFLGVLTIIMFYLSKKVKFSWLIQIIYFTLFFIIFFEGQTIEINLLNKVYYFPTQGFSIFALPLLWMYNGERKGGKIFQYFNYFFYPIHMLILALIRYVI